MLPLYVYVIIAAWAVFLVVWFIMAFGMKKSRGNYLRGWFMRVAIILAVAIILKLTGIHASASTSVPVSGPIAGWIGAALAVLGIAFAVWARFILGRNWGMPMSERAEPELVTGGPYAYVRHPIYTGVTLAILGAALAVSGWWLVFFVVAVIYFAYSAKREERNMLREFPEAYRAYMGRTKMLIPFIY